jgi:hypothetical protein
MKKLIIVSAMIFGLFSNPTNAQTSDIANKKSVTSLDNIISTLYATVSGKKSQERNWNQLRSLCHQDVKFIYYGNDINGIYELNNWTIDEYINIAGEYFRNDDFFEREIHRTVETFGPITHVFSTYESLKSEKNEKPFTRGINSIQLLNDGERWWIINIYWASESEKNPIPAKYLPEN